MTSLVRRSLLGALLVCVALGTTACGFPPASPATPAAPVSDSDPTDAPATPEPAAASGSRPDPAADVTCNDLTNPAQLDPIFAVPVNLAPPTRTFEYVGARIADEWIVRQAGGVACQWSDPEGISTSEGRYLAGIDLRLLPASGPQWQEFSDARGDGSLSWFECSDYGDCSYDLYTATGWWLSLSAFNIDALPSPTAASLRALTQPVFSAIASTVAALPAPDPAWTAPTPDLAFGGGCTGVTTGARIASALGLGTVEAQTYDYPQVARAAMLSIGGSECRWVRHSDGWDVVVHPGATGRRVGPAGRQGRDGGQRRSVPTPAVTGVPAGATALYQHVDSEALDIVLGGTWIKITIANGSATGGLSQEDALVAIAADIAAHA